MRSREFSQRQKIDAAIQCGPFLVDRSQRVGGLNNSQQARRTFAATATNERALLGVCSGHFARGLGENPRHNTNCSGFKNSTRTKPRWRFLERILVCAGERQRIFHSGAKTCARFCGCATKIIVATLVCQAPSLNSSASSTSRRYNMFMRTFGGFRSGDHFFYGELRGDDVHVLAKPYWLEIQTTGEVLPFTSLQIELPVAPSKLIAVGLNYADHIAEMKRTPLGTPLIWFKAPSSLLPHNGAIEIAFPEHQTDFEAELAVVIGKAAKNLVVERALDFVFGYTIGLDISDRDLQKSEKQFGRCKSFDTYTPIGPFVYAERMLPMFRWSYGRMVKLRQSTRTSRMIYSVAQIISFASQSLTLLPGDVILTGTPSGVGRFTPEINWKQQSTIGRACATALSIAHSVSRRNAEENSKQ